MRLMPLAPWLPPMTSTTGRIGSRPSSRQHARWSLGANHGRTGVPVTVTREFFRRLAADGNPTNARFTNRESQRFARPGIVLDSCKKVLAPHVFAARIG